jgi:mitochondrial fission protein ELM1
LAISYQLSGIGYQLSGIVTSDRSALSPALRFACRWPMTDHRSPAPIVWVLLGKGAGGNAQMIALAEALDWPYEAKQMVYNGLDRIPNVILGASLIGVDRSRSAPLAPPWPDLVIAGSRRSAPVARWIKKQSGGRTRLVHLMHTQSPPHHFDLVITTPQYRLPALPNVLHNTGPLNPLPADRLAAAAAVWRDRLAALPRPWTALLVGGNSSAYLLDAPTAAQLGRRASEMTKAAGGALLVSTSPRTPSDAAAALVGAVDCPAHIYRWQRNDPENPYFGFLALADQFIVTADSASQLVEACQTGKPVQVFDWPRRQPRTAMKRALWRWSEHRGDSATPPRDWVGRLFDWLVYVGLIKPPRDFGALRRALRRRGVLRDLGEAPAPAPQPFDDMERAVRRIRTLMKPPE